MFCRICGKEIKNNGQFCPKCGTPIKVKSSDRVNVPIDDNMVDLMLNQDDNEETEESISVKFQETVQENSSVSMTMSADTSNEDQKTDEIQLGEGQQLDSCESVDLFTKVDEGVKKTAHTVKSGVSGIKSLSEKKNDLKTEEKTDKKSGKTIIPIVAAVVVILIAFVIVKGTKKTINLNDYLSVDYEGYNSHGVVSVYLDTDAMLNKYKNKLKCEGTSNAVYELANGDIFSVSKTENLSNGDKIKVTWNMDKDFEKKFNYKFKFTDIEYTVEGLGDIGRFDPFSGISVAFSGTAPDGYAEIIDKNSNYSDYLEYYLDKKDGLSNGDVITLSVECNNSSDTESFVQYLNMVPESVSKQFTVEGLNQYITSASEISDDALVNMQNQAVDVIKAYVANTNSEEEKFHSCEYIGGYVLFANSADIWGDTNEVILVYKVTNNIEIKSENYNGKLSFYYYVQYRDVLVSSGGKNIVELINYETPSDRVSYRVQYGVDNRDYKNFDYKGYETMDDLADAAVNKKLAEYTYEELPGGIKQVETESEEERVTEELNENRNYILPNSNTEFLTEEDLEELSQEECSLARNEIYARHGRKFQDDALREYFESKEWYKGTIDTDDFSDSMFNEYEIANINLIMEYEKKKGYK